VHEELGAESVVVTVFPDDNKKYLSTDLCRDEPVLEHYLSPGIELVGVRAVPRTMARRTPLNPCRAART
jgi:cysteine synthase A